MKKSIVIALLTILFGLLVWGFSNQNGIRAAYANNVWSVDFVNAYFNHSETLSAIGQPPGTHQHAGFYQVKQALLQNDLDAALKYIEPLISSGDPVMLGIYAQVLYQQKKYQQAFDVWESISDESSLWRAAGEMREIEREDLRLATAKSLYDINQEAYAGFYANTLRENHNDTQAIPILLKAIADFPQSEQVLSWKRYLSDVYAGQGRELQNEKKWDQAESLFRQAIDLRNENWIAWKYLGWIYYDRDKNIEKSLECFNKVIELSPDSGEGYRDIGDIFIKEKEFEKALAWYRDVITKFPDKPGFKMTYANLLRDTGQFEQAIGVYIKVIEDFPEEVWAYYELAIAYSSNEHPEAAIQCINEAIRLNPQVVAYHTLAGQVFEQAGDPQQALDAYKKALELDPNNGWAKDAVQRLSSSNP